MQHACAPRVLALAKAQAHERPASSGVRGAWLPLLNMVSFTPHTQEPTRPPPQRRSITISRYSWLFLAPLGQILFSRRSHFSTVQLSFNVLCDVLTCNTSWRPSTPSSDISRTSWCRPACLVRTVPGLQSIPSIIVQSSGKYFHRHFMLLLTTFLFQGPEVSSILALKRKS